MSANLRTSPRHAAAVHRPWVPTSVGAPPRRLNILVVGSLAGVPLPCRVPPDPDVDVVVATGSLTDSALGTIRHLRAAFPRPLPVVLVLGPAELGDCDREVTLGQARRSAAAHGITLLDDAEAVIARVRFVGATLWTDFRLTAPMRTAEVLDHLGIATLQPLLRAAILTPLLPERGNGRDLEFAREDVLALMSELTRDAVPLETEEPDHVDLVSACKVVTRKLADLVIMVRDRRLAQVWHRPTRNGLRSIVISRRELKELAAGPVAPHLAVYRVCERLRVHRRAVSQLIASGVLPSVTLPSPRGGKPSRYVTEDQVKSFQERYVTLAEMAATRRASVGRTKSDLVARGIEPVLHPEDYRTAFYLRSEV